MDLLNDVNQQLVESGGTIDEEQDEEDRKGPAHSSPAHPTEASTAATHLKFSTPSPNKSVISPSKRHLVRFCPLLFHSKNKKKTLRKEKLGHFLFLLFRFLQRCLIG